MPSEARFTSPSEWCPRPDHWHADDAGATEDEVTELVAAFVRALQPEVCVETGTHLGSTALAIGRALQANGHGHLWTVEADPLLAKPAQMRAMGLPVTVVCSDSLRWCPPLRINFGWFDSGIDVRQDEIRRWHERGMFAPGAVIGVHDTGPQHPVFRLLEPLFTGGLLAAPLTLHTPRGVTFARVM